MCVMSAVMDQYKVQYKPHIPDPYTWPQQPWQHTIGPSTFELQRQINELKELLESFRKAVDAAEVFDRLTGQPDCIDPEKAQLLDRVNQLEAKIRRIENPDLVRFRVEFEFELVIDEHENSVEEYIRGFETLNFEDGYGDVLTDHLFESNFKVTVVDDAVHNED